MALPGGYWGRYLLVNLSDMALTDESLSDGQYWRLHVGGSGIGAKLIYDGIPDFTPWSGEKNRVSIFPGPLAGGPIAGAGTFSAVFKGAMSESAGNTQAMGFLGAYLKFNGYDGIVLDGQADAWTVLVIAEGKARLISGRPYLGLDTVQTMEALRADLGAKDASVYSIGPAGENLVRYALLAGDHGHVAAHNGLGAVLGAKKLKAIVVTKGSMRPTFHDKTRLAALAKEMLEYARVFDNRTRSTYGTAGAVPNLARTGQLPVRNYTTNVWAHWEKFSGQWMHEHFIRENKPCWGCSLHCRWTTVTEGPYKGLRAEEPEYEDMGGFGPQIDNPDPGAAVYLTDLTDRLGMNTNELTWTIGWAMECRDKGILTQKDFDGVDLRWGNVEAVAEMMRRIANRQGFGALLAEGVMRASRAIGRGSEELAVYSAHGNTPRGHDHRGRWSELLDTTLSNTGTGEATGGAIDVRQHGLEPIKNRFSPEEVSTETALINGRRMFEDAVSICRFTTEKHSLLVQAVNAATGWDMDDREAMDVGRRLINRLRVFNLKNGLDPQLEVPSKRYGSGPVDGPVAGTAIAPHFKAMRENFWTLMGWTADEGRPLPETLAALQLEELVPAAWPEGAPAKGASRS